MSARERLLELLRRDAWKRGTFTLASGKTSDFFIDTKRVTLTAEGHTLVGEVFCDALDDVVKGGRVAIDAVAGVALGGCPIASAVSLTSFSRGRGWNALYVRKEAKDHGTRANIEGLGADGASVALLEDVLTTGGSSRAAVEQLRAGGYRVPCVIALVDRREGGTESLREAGVDARAVFKREDFLP